MALAPASGAPGLCLRLPHRRAHPPGRRPHGFTYLLPPVQREHALATPPSSALGPSALFTLVSSGASSVATSFPASVSASPSGPAPRPPSRCQPARVSAEATLSPPSPSLEPPLSAGGTVALRRACSLRAPHHPPAATPQSGPSAGPDPTCMPCRGPRSSICISPGALSFGVLPDGPRNPPCPPVPLGE